MILSDPIWRSFNSAFHKTLGASEYHLVSSCTRSLIHSNVKDGLVFSTHLWHPLPLSIHTHLDGLGRWYLSVMPQQMKEEGILVAVTAQQICHQKLHHHQCLVVPINFWSIFFYLWIHTVPSCISTKNDVRQIWFVVHHRLLPWLNNMLILTHPPLDLR